MSQILPRRRLNYIFHYLHLVAGDWFARMIWFERFQNPKPFMRNSRYFRAETPHATYRQSASDPYAAYRWQGETLRVDDGLTRPLRLSSYGIGQITESVL